MALFKDKGLKHHLMLAMILAVTCLGFTPQVEAQTNSLSGWVTQFDPPEKLKPLMQNMSHYETLWLMGPSAQALLEEGQVWWENKGVFRDVAAEARARKISFGPVIHNAVEIGFDAELGVRLVKNYSAVIRRVLQEAKIQKWKAINIDLESLPESAAADYEKFILKLQKDAAKLAIKVSVCLHAKESENSGYEGARFQRWDKLKKIKADYVVMGYDYAWAKSAPGAIAPFTWLEKVNEYAAKNFKNTQYIMALPLFGYQWEKDEKSPNGWIGQPDTAINFQKKMTDKNFVLDTTLKTEDGLLYRKSENTVVAFDDENTFFEKMRLLKVKKVKRFALWRLGAEQESFYKKIESLHEKQ